MTSESVLEIFKTITTIPRESGHEGPIPAYLVKWAADHGLKCKTDSTGNVNIIRKASRGKGHIPTLVLQCHQDMVCEKKADFEFDFSKDPIKYVIEKQNEEYIRICEKYGVINKSNITFAIDYAGEQKSYSIRSYLMNLKYEKF